MACVLMFAALAAIAPRGQLSHSIQARESRPTRTATTGDPPRLSSGHRSARISLRWQAPDAAGAALDHSRASRPRATGPSPR